MVKFAKTIVSEGKIRQWNENTKQFEIVEITKERIESLKENFQKQLNLGMKIPAPWKHDFNVTTLTTGENGLLEDSSINAGFWEGVKVKTLKDGRKALDCIIDAPGDLNDPNTPAGKISKSVKDVSIYTRKNIPITSGVEKEEFLNEGIMHIALVTHPIELNQENFSVLQENEGYLVMSNMAEEPEESSNESEPEELEDSTNNSLTQLVNDLREVCKLYLPATTTIDNLVENLSIAVNQCKLMNDNTSSPDSETYNVEPLLMSQFEQSQIEAIVKSGAVNPKTGKVFAKEDFASQASQPTQTQVQNDLVMSALQSNIQNDRRKNYRTRIDQLVATQRTTKAFADTKLYPEAENYTLQFADNKIVEPVIESLIMSLESIPAPEKSSEEYRPLVMSHSDLSTADEEAIKKQAAYMASIV